MKDYLEAGKFCGTHGVKGDIKAECWCDGVDVLKKLKKVYIKSGKESCKELTVTRCVPFKDLALMHIEGYENPEDAAALKNRIFFAARSDIPLPEGRYFIADLIGLPVIDADDNHTYGVIKDVIEGAASQLYEIELTNGKTALLPVVPAFVVDVDLEKGVLVRPVKGLLDED